MLDKKKIKLYANEKGDVWLGYKDYTMDINIECIFKGLSNLRNKKVKKFFKDNPNKFNELIIDEYKELFIKQYDKTLR